MLVDANVLIYAVHEGGPFHVRARDWLTTALNGQRRVGLPWPSLVAFARVSTHSRAIDPPLSPEAAWRYVRAWLTQDVTWIPSPTPDHADILEGLVREHHLTGDLIADAHVAALAIEHGLTVVSADTDFARFTEITWENPLAPPARRR